MSELRSYWPSSWPAEDGGPRRRQRPAGDAAGLDLTGTLRATTRTAFAPTMCVLREPGEVYLLGHSVGADTVSWVERIHPETLATEVRSPDLPGGPFWPGGLAAHADSSLYITYGRYCHRLDPQTLRPLVSHALPRARPYNSFVVLPSGHLVMKDIAGGVGMHQLPAGLSGSELVVLAPGSLEEVARLELPEGSIARLSADGDDIYVVGTSRCFRVRFADGDLLLDDGWSPRYRTVDGQTYGWDIVLAGGSGWFLDNGEGSEHFGGCYLGGGASTAPLHLVRVSLDGDEVELVEVAGEPGGVVANPPCVDDVRHLVVGYDSGHGIMTAWTYEEGRPGLVERWRRRQNHGGHMLRWPGTNQLLTYDYDVARGLDQVVVLDIETGDELARADTASPVQCVLFPAAGWSDDAYVCTLGAVSRVFTDGRGTRSDRS